MDEVFINVLVRELVGVYFGDFKVYKIEGQNGRGDKIVANVFDQQRVLEVGEEYASILVTPRTEIESLTVSNPVYVLLQVHNHGL